MTMMTMPVYKCEGNVATKHLTRDEVKTICGEKLDYQAKRPKFYNEHELPKEKHCKKCWAKFNG